MPCDGSCCVAFTVGASLDWIKGTRVHDGDLLGFMLRKVTHEEAVERRREFGVALPVNPDHQHYRCVYWNEATRLCGAYENRPSMCSDYPYPLNAQRAESAGGFGDGRCDHGCDCVGAPLVTLGEN